MPPAFSGNAIHPGSKARVLQGQGFHGNWFEYFTWRLKFGHDFVPQGVSSAIGWNFPIPPHALITDQVQSRPDCLFIASRNQGCAKQFVLFARETMCVHLLCLADEVVIFVDILSSPQNSNDYFSCSWKLPRCVKALSGILQVS